VHGAGGRASYALDVLTVLCGGVGAARLLAGLAQVVDESTLTCVINVGDDLVVHGLHISPDIDTVTYTLAGLHNDVTGWGVADESWRVMEELAEIGGPVWFRLGDRDLATHLFRTGRLRAGASLADVTGELARARGVRATMLPVTNDVLATMLTTASGERLSFQEYFVARHHDVEVSKVEFLGAADAIPAPGVVNAIRDATRVVLAPSNPLVSIDPILAVPGVASAIASRREHVIAVSPIVEGAAIKGPADRLLRELGHESSALGVARLYEGLVGTFVIDERDGSLASSVERLGMRCVVTDTMMIDRSRAAALARAIVDA
jgi:LPPG:FO 2-phospho-L-lactate transferase